MRLRPDQLAEHLEKKLLPLYFISGDEPLQITEAGDAVRKAARRAGYTEREILNVGPGFDWSSLSVFSSALSLFSERKFLELRLPSGKPGDTGSKALLDYVADSPDNTLLLILSGRIDRRQQQSKWFRALEGQGGVVQVWPVEYNQLPGWIARRMEDKGLKPTAEATRLLAERVEGNLLAAAQEIEKLGLLHGEGPVGIDAVLDAVAGSSRYNPFELLEAALLGDQRRTVRILEGLRGEGVEPLVILGALTWELRNLAKMAEQAKVEGVERAMSSNRVWDKRKPGIRAALQRHGPKRWQGLLARCARIDRTAKGVEPGNPWDELLQLSLIIAGQRLF